jgi:hypothetical protein
MTTTNSQNYVSPNFAIPYVTPSNVPDNLVPIIKPIYVSLQNIIQTIITTTGIAPRNAGTILVSLNDPSALLANNMHRLYVQSSELILPGAAVNLFAPINVLTARNANASIANKPCDAFCSQAEGIPAGGIGEIILNDGVNYFLTGLIPGTRYYLDILPGKFTSIPPVASGNLEQSIGIAITETALRFWTGDRKQH